MPVDSVRQRGAAGVPTAENVAELGFSSENAEFASIGKLLASSVVQVRLIDDATAMREGALEVCPDGPEVRDESSPVADEAPTAIVVEPTFGEEPSKDGRVARGQRTRRKVAEALIDLLHEGDPDPTAKAIAQRAGVSLRLVFHHFSDMDDLYRAVASLQLESQWRELPDVSPKLPLRTRIAHTVHHRSQLYEDIAPVRRATARRAASSAEISAALVVSDALLTENLSTSFAPELDTRPVDEGSEMLAAMDAASSWEAWDRLRRNSELPSDTASRVMTRTLTALLS